MEAATDLSGGLETGGATTNGFAVTLGAEADGDTEFTATVGVEDEGATEVTGGGLGAATEVGSVAGTTIGVCG